MMDIYAFKFTLLLLVKAFKLISMKQPLNEEFYRMQKLAGLINESQLSETKLFADFSLESESDNSLKSRFARSISEIAREYDYIDNIDIPEYFDVYEEEGLTEEQIGDLLEYCDKNDLISY